MNLKELEKAIEQQKTNMSKMRLSEIIASTPPRCGKHFLLNSLLEGMGAYGDIIYGEFLNGRDAACQIKRI